MADISDFKIECAKTFLMKLLLADKNQISDFWQKFQAFLELASRESDKNTPLSPFCSRKLKD